jgi:dTMP kinase
MAHQGGKILDKEKRFEMYKWLEELEYGLGDLPKPDATVLLYVPYQYALELKKSREESPDQHETSEEHLKNAEKAYLELAKRNNHIIINCVDNNKMRSIEDIHEEIYNKVISKLLR